MDQIEEFIILKDVRGDVAGVLRGGYEVYRSTMCVMKGVLGKLDGFEGEYEDSEFYKNILLLIPYVCDGDARAVVIKEDEVDLNHPDEYGSTFDVLYSSAEAVYTVWQWSLQEQSFGISKPTKDYRLFSIFSQAAWLRLNIDYEIHGNFYSTSIADEDDIPTYFTAYQLCLLCGWRLPKADSSKSLPSQYSSHGNPESIPYPKNFNKLYVPVTPEMKYYYVGREPNNKHLPNLILREDAIEYLNGMGKQYQSTRFV